MGSQRIAYYDYLKALAIFLVIWGHIKKDWMTGIGLSNSVDIPLFLMISGILLYPKTVDRDFWSRIFSTMILPYIFWSMAETTLGLGKKVFSPDVFETAGFYIYGLFNTLWYVRIHIVCLILWQLLCFKNYWVRYGAGLALLLGCNLALCQYQGEESVILRVARDWASISLYAYAFFALGACLKSFFTADLSSQRLMFQCAIASIVSAVLLFYMKPHDYHYFVAIFQRLYETGAWYIFFIRLGVGVFSSVALISGAMLLDRHLPESCRLSPDNYISRIGRNTLQLYMFHALLVSVILLRYISLPGGFLGFMLSFLSALAVVAVCSWIIDRTSRTPGIKTLFWGR